MHFTSFVAVTLATIGSTAVLAFPLNDFAWQRLPPVFIPIPTRATPTVSEYCHSPLNNETVRCIVSTYNPNGPPVQTPNSAPKPPIPSLREEYTPSSTAPVLRPVCTTMMAISPMKTFDFGETLTVYEKTVFAPMTVECGGCALTWRSEEMGPGPMRRVTTTVTEAESTMTLPVCAGPTSRI